MSNKYDSYKDSGVEWIGKIPEHWNVKKTIHYFKAEKGKKAALLTKEYCGTIEGIYPVYSGQTENNGIMCSINEYEFDFSDDGCLLSTTVGAKAMSINFIRGKFSLSQNCMVITSRDKSEIINKFFFYQFQPIFNFHRNLIPDHMQPSFRMDDLYQFKIIVPSKEEQNTIANYLDHKTTQIDHLIAKKEQFIQLLEEERVAVINQAVTKGLDPSVPMKNSGIEWLGEIPEHWKKTRLKRLIDEIFLGLTAKVDYVENPEDGVAFIRAGNLFGGKLDLSDMKYISRKQHESLTKFRQVQRGDVLVTKSGSIGVCAILDVDGEFSLYESVFAIRPTREFLLNEYLLLLLNSHLMKQQYTADMVGMGVHHLNMGDMKNTIIPIPSIEEQESILNEIKVRIDEIELILVKIREELELLKEYKTALISEVVTGKVDIRDEKLN